jgi:hypothetical protein
MEDVGIFDRHLVYLTAIGYILWPFGIFCGNFVYFYRFGMLHGEKSGNPGYNIRRLVKFTISKKYDI